MKWSACVFLLALFPWGIRAGELPAFLPTVWGVEEGLPQQVVGAVAQTALGDIWCGTFNGLARFDGVKFTIFDEKSQPPLPGRGVTVLYEDRKATLWVGMESGGVTQVVDRVPVASPPFVRQGSGPVLSIAEDGTGDLWILWQDGVILRWRDGLQVKPAPEVDLSEPELRLVQDGDGALWLTHKNGFAMVGPDGLVEAQHNITAEGGGLQRAGACTAGGLWVAAEGKLRRWHQGAWAGDFGPCPWDLPGQGGSHFVSVLRELKDGRLLVGMVDGGIATGVPGQSFHSYTRKQGLPNDWIRCASEDREGTLWLGTGGGGLAALHGKRVIMMPIEPEDSQHNIQSLLSAGDGSFWVATEGGGLFQNQPGLQESFVHQESLPTGYIWSVMEDLQGRIWIGTWGGGLWIREKDGGMARAPHWPAGESRVTVLKAAQDGSIWAGGLGTLWRSTSTGWESRDPDGELLAPAGQRAIAEDAAGGLWIGLNDGRVLHRHAGQREFYDQRQGLPGDAVIMVTAGESGTIWLGTAGGGLLRIREGRINRFTTAQGLPHNVVSQILAVPGDSLWLGTYGGICRLNLEELDACADGRLSQLNALVLRRSDGMATVECSTGGSPGACATRDGRLWFPTSKGLAIVNPSMIQLNPLPPPVLLESFTADGHPFHDIRTPVVLKPGTSGIAIAYTALSFRAPDRVRFRTRLNGLEKTWQDAGTERLATYRYLAPGPYTFHVTACNNDGLWNHTGVSLSFTILPYFWQRPWFLAWMSLVVTGGVGGLVWAATRRRNAARLAGLERSHALERERTRIARDIHDDLGSGLTRIMLLSQSARSEVPTDNPAAAELDNVCRAAEGLTRTMDEIVWAVDPRHDTLESLIGYIGSTAQELLQSARIRFRLEAPDQLPAWPITADCRHSLFLATKEALHNIVRHAQARTARLIFQVHPHAFSLTIEDDGCGFAPGNPATRPGGGRGLANMQARLTEAGGTCTLTTHPGTGTRLTFHLPYPAGSLSSK